MNLLKSDLLATDGLVAMSSTRDFLLGLTWTLVSFCHAKMDSRLESLGADAFDASYLRIALGETRQEADSERNSLFHGITLHIGQKQGTPQDSDFAGATHFFFLSCLLMRVALHPALRMEEEFHFRYHKEISTIQGRAMLDEASPPNAFKSATPIVAVWFGWKTFLEDPDFASCMTELSLIQLRWLIAMAQERDNKRSLIPDWFCREPARWLSRLANTSPRLLKPHQAEKAIQFVATLLDMATAEPSTHEGSFHFSPIVVTSLIQVASSFVQAGVNRARRKQQLRWGKSKKTRKGVDEVGDDRDLEVYLSFDKNDLGVTVFAHRTVKEKLCPTLLRTFRAVDVVEGFDADRDNAFNKFSAKSQIAGLLLRLWSHPTGECRESVALLPASEIRSFASSVSTAARVDLDFAIEAIEKVYKASDEPQLMSRGMQNYIEQHVSQAASQLRGTRSYLVLFCGLSRDERVAAYLGGRAVDSPECQIFLTNLANMIVQFLEKLTARDGGTNQSLEDGNFEASSMISPRLAFLTRVEKKHLAEGLVRRRIHAINDLGLAIDVMCHQLLALAAKWHLAAASMEANQARVSPFLMALADNEDCDLIRMEHVMRRLVAVPGHIEGSEANNADAIFEHDGYVDHSTWSHKYEKTHVSETLKMIRRTAKQDQMKHADVAEIASNDDIIAFLDDLRERISTFKDGKTKALSPMEIVSTQQAIMSGTAATCEDDYSNSLSEWTVSSSPFGSQQDGSNIFFLHCYDKAIRNRGIVANVKTLLKEARKCHKWLPPPSPNSATYVCFAEERMDLCRVIVSGPIDTPYSHGLFEFDVYFPPTYPQVPPLVTFMTTGT